ncbi:MAG: prepilin-type N-terminal cleavage/methylation domain-containing protein [Candidatus Saccharibacteria bacterium]
MSFHKQSQDGFSVIELMIALALAVLISIMFFTLFKTSFLQYLNIQQDASTATTLAGQESRVSTVLRGATSVVSASDNDLVIYSYFYPSDTYVSLLHYYVSSGQLLADLTPMSANPPTGTPLTANLRTYTIIPNFYQAAGTPTFVYLDSSNAALPTPVTDLNAIKAIQVNLAAKASNGGNQSMTLQVSLRNFKTNL